MSKVMASSGEKKIFVSAPTLNGNEIRYVTECLESTWISSSGRFLDRFEEEFAKFCGVKHAIACNNGTTALHLALAALNVGPGDEIIVPDLTYIASANAVRYCGANPVFVDNDVRTFNIDPESIEAAITPKTKGIIVVHLYGHPCDMDRIVEIADRYSLFVVEDAAEAHGALYRGKRVGGLTTCGCFSFFGNKIITTGEGGAVTTNDDILAERLRLLRGQGMDPKRRYWFPVIGFNYRMTNLAAALGLAQLEHIGEALDFRKRIAQWYDEGLSSISHVIRPHTEIWADHVFWMYTILLADTSKVSRDRMIELLDSRGIETRPVFYPMHLLPPYEQDGVAFKNATYCGSRGINLPTHGQLLQSDIRRICSDIQDILKS